MSANSSGAAFDLRCEVREKLIAFLQREHPEALPRERSNVSLSGEAPAVSERAPKRRKKAA
jgi:hypothetical protein